MEGGLGSKTALETLLSDLARLDVLCLFRVFEYKY